MKFTLKSLVLGLFVATAAHGGLQRDFTIAYNNANWSEAYQLALEVLSSTDNAVIGALQTNKTFAKNVNTALNKVAELSLANSNAGVIDWAGLESQTRGQNKINLEEAAFLKKQQQNNQIVEFAGDKDFVNKLYPEVQKEEIKQQASSWINKKTVFGSIALILAITAWAKKDKIANFWSLLKVLFSVKFTSGNEEALKNISAAMKQTASMNFKKPFGYYLGSGK